VRETSKAIFRKLSDSRFISRYFVGDGIDIGGKPDPLELYKELFPLARSIRTWDLEDGDALLMSPLDSEQFDFVYSSHCLEHLTDPYVGLNNWFRILRPDGHLIVTIPDEDLYEQGVWPSRNNNDHKFTFSINKQVSWSPVSISVFDLIHSLGDFADVKSIQLQDYGYRYSLPSYDQTIAPISESAIEFIIRKRTSDEVARRGLKPFGLQPPEHLRRHYNQYRLDFSAMKANNQANPPFMNEENL
jgi:SAM-dependent methyltransferase